MSLDCYGLPYMGGKGKLAERIIGLLPGASHFYDVFAGGCSVSHYALLSGKYGAVHANDINEMPQVFLSAVAGKYGDEQRWISHEDFFRLRATDPYVRLVWSFGNDMRTYMYSREQEPVKKAMHHAAYYSDPALLLECGIDVSEIVAAMTTVDERATGVCAECRKSKGANMARLQNHERMTRIRSLQSSCDTSYMSVTMLDYRDVNIAHGSVIYCDPPYKGTKKYTGALRFDHEGFYEWCLDQTEPLFVSGYEMPPEFLCVAEFRHISTISATHKGAVKERLFIPAWQADRMEIVPKRK